MSVRVARPSEIPAVAAPVEGLTWHPVRHTLDINAFGTNAYTAAAVSDLVVEPHDEDEFEELYVVLTGAARFVVDGETVEAPTGEHEPERNALAAERSSILRAAVASLSEREQQILSLVHVHELQGAEIGRMLGVSESRVSQILAGIRRKLREAVDGYERTESLAA